MNKTVLWRASGAAFAGLALPAFAQTELASSIASRSGVNSAGPWAWWIDLKRSASHGQPLTFATATVASGALGSAGTPVTGAVSGLNTSNTPWSIVGTGTAHHTVQDHAKLKLTDDFSPTLTASYTLGGWHNAAEGRPQSDLNNAAGQSGDSGPVNLDGRSDTLATTAFPLTNDRQTHTMPGLSVKRNTRGEFDGEVAASRSDDATDQQRAPTVALPLAAFGGAGTLQDQGDGRTGWNTLSVKGTWRPQGIGPLASAHIVDFGVGRDSYKLGIQNASLSGAWFDGDALAPVSNVGGRAQTFNAWVQHSWRYAPKEKTVLGLRYEDWRATDGVSATASSAQTDPARSEAEMSPKVALACQLSDDAVLKTSRGALSLINDSTLRPEKSWTGALSFEPDLGRGLARATLVPRDHPRRAVQPVDPELDPVPAWTTVMSMRPPTSAPASTSRWTCGRAARSASSCRLPLASTTPTTPSTGTSTRTPSAPTPGNCVGIWDLRGTSEWPNSDPKPDPQLSPRESIFFFQGHDMTKLSALRAMAACAVLTSIGSAMAHIALPPGGATAGADYEAAFLVSHACKDAQATTGLTVRLPKGFTLVDAPSRKGWKLDLQKTGDAEVRWLADNAAAALPSAERAEFIVRGKLATTPGPIYFKVLQRCDNGSVDWAQLPTGAAGEALAFPAVRLDVLAPGNAAVDVKDAWIRPTVAGQSGTGAFMKLSAPAGTRLVGASTPAAGVAEVHEMKMEGDVMKMRAVQGGLELPPRQTVELKPSGVHLMLTDLKQTLAKGSSVPLTLRFEDAKGLKSTLELTVPVGALEGTTAQPHMHMH